MPIFHKHIKLFIDLLVTVIVWTYFTLGYAVFFSPFYFSAVVLSKNREESFQRLNHTFYRIFFLLVRLITPGIEIRIQDDVYQIRSSVIVCNHISYLDPILLISLFQKQKTIVKAVFFRLPIFGWVLKTAGYIPSTTDQDLASLMIARLKTMGDFLLSGGNFFVFPEGTRSRDNRIGPLNKGAFKIARQCHAPVKVLRIRNTNILFTPGRFLFNTCVRNTIEIELIGSLTPDYESDTFSISDLTAEVQSLLEP